MKELYEKMINESVAALQADIGVISEKRLLMQNLMQML